MEHGLVSVLQDTLDYASAGTDDMISLYKSKSFIISFKKWAYKTKAENQISQQTHPLGLMFGKRKS